MNGGRLTIEQVRAPDFSASSEMLARAGQSFDRGLESAKSILGKYNEGQQAKDDLFALTEIAKARDETELDTLLNSGAFDNLNLSDTVRAGLGTKLRGDIIGNVNFRDSNSRSNAIEADRDAENTDRVNSRAELRSLTPLVAGNAVEGRQYGNAGPPNQAWLEYNNQNATRNDPLAPELVNSMSFVGDMGLTMKVISGGQEDNKENGTGSTRHNHGNSADVDFYDANGRKLDWNNPNDVPVFQEIVSRAKANGVTGIGGADDYMGAGRLHVGFGAPGVWGAGGKGENAPEWLKAAYNGAPAGSAPITSNPQGGPANTALQDAIRQSVYLEPSQALELLQTGYDAQKEGQALIDDAEKKRQSEAIAAATIGVIQDPTLTTDADRQRALLTIPGVSPTNALDAGSQDLSRFDPLTKPNVPTNPLVEQSNEQQRIEDERAASLDPTIQAFETAKAFNSTSNIGAAMVEQLGLPDEGVTSASNINKEIARFAKDNNLEPGEAAAVFDSLAKDGLDVKELLQAATDTDAYQTMKRRASELFNQDSRTAAEDRERIDLAASTQRAAIEAESLKARTYAARLPNDDPRKADATARVNMLDAAAIAVNQPEKVKKSTEEYLSSAIQGFDKSQLVGMTSEEARQFEAAIKADKNLSEEQKMILIMGLRL